MFKTLFARPARSRYELAWRRDMSIMLLIGALALLALLAAPATPAYSQSTIFLTDRNGQIPFPILPPNRATGGPGFIDNMTIGATTPRPGSFTTLSSTSAPSGAGITALFASPPAIGTVAPAAGSFTTLKATDGLVCASYNQVLTAAIGDHTLFIATRPYILVSVSQVHAVAAGGASLLQVTKDTGTDAPGAGTDLLTNNTNTGFDLNATANTVQVGTLVVAATRTLATGDRLGVDFSAAIQSSSGISVTACLAPQ